MGEPTAEESASTNDLEVLFADRYTIENPTYAKIAKGFDKVVMVQPWPPHQPNNKRRYDNNFRGQSRPYQHRGWRPRGGYQRNYYNDRSGEDNSRKYEGHMSANQRQ
ncbi:unnamed protein product [Caenorhabditis auriculariae]|uniref:Uncharacterized protein n=1 Tax=Caenorhabditis auriculariae TaxID=2777116 RepID=A0A8S1GLV8_9PELO|nr:unnamed protein product [Caenorhabditis auriculariae]